MKPGWYVVDHEREDMPLRGPYAHAETAGAVRSEMEDRWPDRSWNLWVVHIDAGPPGEDKP